MKKSMYRGILLWLVLIIQTSRILAVEKHTISGYVKDGANGEALIGATISIAELSLGTVTNEYGFYSLSVTPGKYQVQFSFIGYTPVVKELILNEDRTFNIELKSDDIQLNDVVVTAQKKDQNVKSVQMSVEKVPLPMVRKLPHFLGEVDIIKTLQMLPGVSTVGDGSSGFNVRGGGTDQNLILLDEAPVYNSSHLFGFFSVFNGDAVKDFQLYKGGIPAQYGGRLSSVLDVRQKEGNSKRFSGSGGIGLVSSRLTLEGPIKKDKTSFMLSGRRSYADVLLRINPKMRDNIVYFYDLNAKINHKFNDNNRLYISGYFGNDVFKFGKQFDSHWGNKTATVRWNHLFSKKLFSNFTGIYSNFDYSISVPEGTMGFEWKSSIQNYNLKADFSYFPNPDVKMKFGFGSIYYQFNPGKLTPVKNSVLKSSKLEKENALESAAYFNMEQNLGPNLSVQYGLRASNFTSLGEKTVYSYEANKPKEKESSIGSKKYNRNEVIKNYFGLEPRVAIKYSLSDVSSLKASYNRTRQYIHRISNTTAPTPLDIWVPAGKHIKPAKVDQFALGYFRNFGNNTWETSIELFHKNFHDLVEYKYGAQLLLNSSLETELLTAKGRAYGMELSIRKKEGRLTGWVAYTLSRSEKKVPGLMNASSGETYPSTQINNGKYFPADYDKTHDLKIVANYELSKRWSFATNFILMSGRPITYPYGKYELQGNTYAHYINRNQHRLPTYHRLDISFTYQCKKKKKDQRWQASWNFGITNLYSRHNAYSVYFKESDNNWNGYNKGNKMEAWQFSIIGRPVPTITYNFKF
ncbi:TonB-dependent receptor [Marinifilum sp. D737]|uniref:TonB-dependent receptor n=1 Tax=Marinifilum sp. D737 TaxID=2969628 RepID=UPI0022723437|nr:TonB-dependent receptor [Marinifilum sp. D737]MCY1633048.1 TonB-dependent receptor [Marinifilum sp. D737]